MAKIKRNKVRKGSLRKSFKLIWLVVLLLACSLHVNETVVHKERLGLDIAMPECACSVNSQVVRHLGYVVSYNSEKLSANWAAYELTSEEVSGKEPRVGVFASDPGVPGRQPVASDYGESGWDKGHLVPAADMKWSPMAMEECFYMTNISPQNKKFNRGVWKSIEGLVRDVAVRYGNVIVVVGPVFTTDDGLGCIGASRVPVPNAFFKVLLVNNGAYEAVGFYCENVGEKKDLASYAMSVDQIEEITGIDFFHSLPDGVEEVLENHYDLDVWGLKSKKN